MEYLHKCLNSLKRDPDFNFHPRCQKLGIEHLCFADDLLMFARGDEQSVQLLKEKFTLFSEASELKANLSKSQVYFGGVQPQEQNHTLNLLGYEVGELAFKYLGDLLSTKKLTVLQCKPLVNKITARITTWMAKCLSYAGRLQLIKTMLFRAQTYWTQLFLLLQKVIKLIEAIYRSYLWSGEATITKRALVSWESICLPRGAGGLNILNLKIWNQAAICELLWALSLKKDKLWISWVHTYYIMQQNLNDMKIFSQTSWMVRKIIQMRKFWVTLGDQNTLLHRGKFHISAAYKRLRGDVPNMAWKQLHKRLRTKDLLLKWGIPVTVKYIFCSNVPETAAHLYFECSYTHTIRKKILDWQKWERHILNWDY
ncbi:uncharacterized protein LOC132612903 [Lycium barbarum]|uniref:uncharacterized protein LOC132612903 n=1 Tax=Lycium barbarum TaxID=112863 RepID=UPI00293EB434|nr:uncharacterized protein LOC132612903 [Lycium barbarum]